MAEETSSLETANGVVSLGGTTFDICKYLTWSITWWQIIILKISIILNNVSYTMAECSSTRSTLSGYTTGNHEDHYGPTDIPCVLLALLSVWISTNYFVQFKLLLPFCSSIWLITRWSIYIYVQPMVQRLNMNNIGHTCSQLENIDLCMNSWCIFFVYMIHENKLCISWAGKKVINCMYNQQWIQSMQVWQTLNKALFGEVPTKFRHPLKL